MQPVECKYRELEARTPSRLGDGEVENPYIGGAVFLQFLHTEFGRPKAQAIMSNAAKAFDEAVRDALDIGKGELFEWARAKFSASK